MARFRRGSVFVRDLREHSIPLDRNQAARILFLAERLEVATKAKGRRNGCLGAIGLAVLRVLVLRFQNRSTGICCPSYGAIQRATGLCRQAVTDALDRLASAGIVQWTRRLVRDAAGCRQASNVYRIGEPRPAGLMRPAPPRPKRFPARGPLAALAALATAESAQKAANPSSVQIEPTTYWRPVHDWRERARESLQRAMRANAGA